MVFFLYLLQKRTPEEKVPEAIYMPYVLPDTSISVKATKKYSSQTHR